MAAVRQALAEAATTAEADPNRLPYQHRLWRGKGGHLKHADGSPLGAEAIAQARQKSNWP
jgi:hypothetical protein